MFSFILSNKDNIILFSIVEYKSFNFDSDLATASFIISILCLLVLLGILVFIPWHLYQLRKQKEYQSKEDKLKAHDSSKVLFEEVKDKYFIQQLYLFIICFRVVLHNVIIGALETPIQPNAQISGDVILVSNIIVIAFSMLMSGLKVLVKVLPIIKEELLSRKNQPKSIQTEQTPLALQTQTEECSLSAKSPKHTETEGESLLAVPDEDTESNKIEAKTMSPIRPLDTG